MYGMNYAFSLGLRTLSCVGVPKWSQERVYYGYKVFRNFNDRLPECNWHSLH